MDDATVRLTQFSRGAGCGCKIAPKALAEILQTNLENDHDPNLLVGNSSNDDAAVYNLGNGQALISTTDFFMPIVDDAFDFGRIAAANAISDVYAMGGNPLLATAILGWPVEKLPASLASQVLDGARTICKEAGIPLAGGHSIDATEPIFGLSVNGIAPIISIKKNNTAKAGDFIFLTKAIGTGVLSTAQKRGVIKAEHVASMISQMTTLNTIGRQLAEIPGVTAMTDITGFGLLGHLIEMAAGANLSAELYYELVPVMEGVKDYIGQRIVPDATYRNWNSYSSQTGFEKGVNVMEAFNLLPDPQTNGGLLFSVNEKGLSLVKELLKNNQLQVFMEPIGQFTERSGKTVFVKQSRNSD
ncbi:MAG: selenide, water dikinase SelD [Chitinophagaceae bacterium]|nr:MAG: selenide, water dikinase SelD [Chitinophagaceae bacterium]